MYRNFDMFFSFQLDFYRLFGVIISKEMFINAVSNAKAEILNIHYLSYEKRLELIEFLTETAEAIISNNQVKFYKARRKEILNILKEVIHMSNMKQEDKLLGDQFIEWR